jgi:hypothetical protein
MIKLFGHSVLLIAIKQKIMMMVVITEKSLEELINLVMICGTEFQALPLDKDLAVLTFFLNNLTGKNFKCLLFRA